MKKRLFLFVAIVAIVACVFAISASADSINPSTSNEFGTLTTFDEEIGNSNISPNKDDGTVARTVLFDGNGNYYTVPTYYILEESYKSGKGEMFLLNFSEVSTKLGLSTNLQKNNIIRCEIPSDIDFIASSNENLSNCNNIVEIKINDGLRFWDSGSTQFKAFTNCKSLKSIDISGMIIEYAVDAFALFEYCESLEEVILPDAYVKDGTPVNYDTDHMFSGCKKLKTIENLEGFMCGVTSLGYKTFYNCNSITGFKLWDGLQVIEGRAFGNCSSITEIIIPDTVISMGTTETVFESCTSLKTVVMSLNTTSLGSYCFEKCKALEKVFMPAPWINNPELKLTMSNQIFGQAEKSGVEFYLMCTEEQLATYIDQSAYTDDNKTDAWKHGTFVYGATLSDKCTIFIGSHTKPASINTCTSGGNCTICATAIEGIATSHKLVTTVTFDNGFAQEGVKKVTCQNWENCTEANSETTLAPLFEASGYSYKQNTSKTGLTGGFAVNPDSLKEYRDYNPDAEALVVTLLIVNPKCLSEDGFFGEDGAVATTQGAVQVDISELTYENYNYIVSGFTAEHMQSLELAFAMVVINGEHFEVVQKQYAENETSTAKAIYKDNNNISLYSVTVESVDPSALEALLPSNDEETV